MRISQTDRECETQDRREIDNPNQFNSLLTAQWYSAGLRAGCSGVRVPAEAANFSLHHRVQTGSGAHPTSYPMGTRVSFPGGKAVGA
jgi:hypothetical protein